MAGALDHKPSRIFYRRVIPDRWFDEKRTTPEESLWHKKENEEGISVFDASKATPDDVLQHQINLWEKTNRAKKLAECAGTVEGLRRIGWGVVEISEAEFMQRGFVPDEETDAYGHLEVKGSVEDFQLYAPDLVTLCRRCD